MEKENIKPDCSKWNVWEGKEIEGFTDVNKRTLFVRHASRYRIQELVVKGNYTRLWFCDEYNDLEESWIRDLSDLCPQIIFGVTYEKYLTLPSYIKKEFQIYLQLNNLTDLKENDHIKLGPLYHEESFLIGMGAKAVPQLYTQDIKID